MGEHAASWTKVRTFMQRQCGVALTAEQEYLFIARLEPVANEQRFASLEDYVDAVCRPGARADLVDSLIDAMTTHETSFFRDRNFWSTLQSTVLPALDVSESSAPLRVWSAAASTGQEAYSLAMLLEEVCPRVAARCTILGTDVSERVLDLARAGRYSVMEVNRGLNAARLARHFDADGGGFRVKAQLRQRVHWMQHNVLNPPPTTDCHIVLCRNVLIYFAESERSMAVSRLRSAAHPRGFIAVGGTEILPGPQVAPGLYRASPSAAARAVPEERAT